MSYLSPIETIIRNMNSRFEDGVYRAVQNVGIHVDKAELEKALLYDRNQYVKGFEDAVKTALKIIDDELESWELVRKVMGYKPEDDNAEAALAVARSLIKELTEDK